MLICVNILSGLPHIAMNSLSMGLSVGGKLLLTKVEGCIEVQYTDVATLLLLLKFSVHFLNHWLTICTLTK